MPPLNEQIADRITNGSLTEARTQMRTLGEKYTELYSETRKLSRQVETLKEGGTLAEGYADHSWDDRLALDHRWQLMSGQAQHRIIQYSDVVLYYDLMSYAYQYCPLIKAAVDTKTRYTFGLSFSIESELDTNKTLIDEIMSDPRNRNAIFGAQALAMSDREIQKAGSIYMAMWIDESPVQVRVWTAYDITDVILDPEDGDTPLYYVRSWAPPGGGKKTVAYPSIFNTSPESNLPREFSGYLVDPSIVVYQMSEGRAAKQKWALSPYTSALPWNRAYEQFLLDFAAIVQIIRKYSTMFTTKGGEAQVSALSTQFNHEQHGHHAQQVGDGIIATEGNDFKVIDAGSGKIVGLADARQILMQFTTSTGVPENLLTGNPQTGNRASAQELTANFLPIIEERQTMWTETFRAVFSFILGNSDLTVSFPPIRSQDSLTYLQGLINSAKYVQPEDIIRAVYEALDLKIPEDATIDEMVQGIMDAIATNPADTAALDNLTQATNQMNATIAEMMKKSREEWNPDQPRDDDGKWSGTGGGGGSSGGTAGGSGDSGGSSSKSTDSDDDFMDNYFKDALGEEGYQNYKDELAGKKAGSPKIEVNEHELDHFSATAARENPVFSKDEDIGVNTYKSGSYKEVNDYCRGDRDNREFTDAIDYHGVQTQTPSQAVERIDSAMSHFQTDTDTEVYRGIGENTANKLLKTNVVENSGYSSTAISPEVAYGFAKSGDDGYKHIMKFTVPKGTNYLYWNEETELMLPRNLKLKEVSRVEYSRLYVDGKTVSGNAQFGMPKIMIHNMVIV